MEIEGRHLMFPSSQTPEEDALRGRFRQPPPDSFNGVYAIFFILGIGSLLPWNVFCTAKHYWLYKLGNGTDESLQHKDLLSHFESYLSIASTVPSVVCLIINYLLVDKISAKVRVLSALFIMLAIFCITTVLVKVDTSTWTYGFFGVTMCCAAIVSGASNVFLGSVFGEAGRFPMRNAQALISGQAMGGTISALASIVDLAAAGTIEDSALAYFITADIFIMICIVMYLLLPKIPYSNYYLKNLNDRPQHLGDETSSVQGSETYMFNGSVSSESLTGDTTATSQLKSILTKTASLGFSVFYTFFISIIIFPSIASNIKSTSNVDSMWTTKYFIPMVCFLLYNFADWAGRQVTAWIQIPGPKSALLPTLVLFRTLFLPLFIFCNYQPREHLPIIFFAGDFYPAIFIAALGFTNGYLGTLPMIYGPKIVPKELSEHTGIVMSFYLALGLAAGSACSVLVVHLI
ncbi:equilibrative nucleoside transporter 3 [Rhinoraja longicauda]